MYRKFKDHGLEIIAVNGIGESKADVKAWAERHGLTFPVGFNKTSTDLVGMFKVRAYPTNVLYDREGKVIYKGEGFDPAAVMKALGEAGIR